MKKLLILCVLLNLCFLGCGSVDGTLETSMVTATVDTLTLDSDVVSWVDAEGATAPACALTSFAATPAADEVNVSVISKAYSNTGTMGLPILVESATISYVPANSSTPAMANEYQIIGMKIANGATATLPIRVATHEQKIKLRPILSCNNTIYNYYTKITFVITEIGTDKKTTLVSSMQLRFADYVDK